MKVKVIVNRTIKRDENGFVLKNIDRPYQFEIKIADLILFSGWYNGSDEKSENLAKKLAQILSETQDIEVEIK